MTFKTCFSEDNIIQIWYQVPGHKQDQVYQCVCCVCKMKEVDRWVGGRSENG